MIDVGTILGGFVSGILGGAVAVEYRHRRNRVQELLSWYERTERLAERVNIAARRCQIDSYQPYGRNTCAGVHSALARHLSEAPPSVDEEVFKEAEKLVMYCQRVKRYNEDRIAIGEDTIQPQMDNAGEQAQETQEVVMRGKENAGWMSKTQEDFSKLYKSVPRVFIKW